MSKTEELRYAHDLVWCYKNMGTPIDDLRGKEGVTQSRLILFDWTATPEGRETFLKTLLPKAQDSITKSRAAKDPDSIIEKEVKSIADLKEFVKTVVAEALTETLEARDTLRRQNLGKTGLP